MPHKYQKLESVFQHNYTQSVDRILKLDTESVCEDQALDKWDPMTEAFEHNRNTYEVDTDDPGVALTGYRK